MAGLIARSCSAVLKKAVCVNVLPKAGSHVQPIRYPSVTYNDMTKPEGPWQKKYDEMDAEYSRYMYAGLATLAISAVISYYCLDPFRYSEPAHKNTPEGLAFLNPNPEIIEDIQN